MRGNTHVVSIPCPIFSFLSVEDFPLLRLDHPRAVLRAFDPTLGRALGASPNAFSRLGSISLTTKGVDTLRAFGVGAAETTFELNGISCRASGLKDANDRSPFIREGRM